MDELIMKFKTKYDLNSIEIYNRYNLYHKPVTWIITILSVALILLGIFASNMGIIYRVFSIGAGIIWLLEIMLLPKIRAKSTIKTSNITKGAVVEVEFKKDNIFMITKKKEDIIGTSIIEYSDLYKVCSANDYLYVYISKDQAILCSKENMTGKYSKFIKFLKDKIGKKYRGK